MGSWSDTHRTPYDYFEGVLDCTFKNYQKVYYSDNDSDSIHIHKVAHFVDNHPDDVDVNYIEAYVTEGDNSEERDTQFLWDPIEYLESRTNWWNWDDTYDKDPQDRVMSTTLAGCYGSYGEIGGWDALFWDDGDIEDIAVSYD